MEYICRYWQHLKCPRLSLKELLDAETSLGPVMVTDAKALFDSHHREGLGGSVVDKRVGLEIKVVKDRLQILQGVLKWMSSERQLADGLTKEAARNLLAERLRHARLKLTWDPLYVAAKKKSVAEMEGSKHESIAKEKKFKKVEKVVPSENLEIISEEIQDENVFFVRSNEILVYEFAASHVVPRRRNYVKKFRMSYVYMWILVFVALFTCAGIPADQCPLEDHEDGSSDGSFELGMFVALQCAVLLAMFLLGVWCQKPKRIINEQETQTTLIQQRLKEAWKRERQKNLIAENKVKDAVQAAEESRVAFLAVEKEWEDVCEQVREGRDLVKQMQMEMMVHAEECAAVTGVEVAVKSGECWHFPDCDALRDVPRKFRRRLRACQICNPRLPPPLREDTFFGGCLADDIAMWLEETKP